MVNVTQLLADTDVSIKFAEAYIEPSTRIHIPMYNHKREFVADVMGTYVMMRIIDAFQAKTQEDVTEIDQVEPYDMLQDAWYQCRTIPYDTSLAQWFTEDQVQACITRVCNLIHSYGVVEKVDFEVPVAWDGVWGRADCVIQYSRPQEKIVFEFKCVQELTPQHRMQTSLYTHMLQNTCKGNVRGVLFNILSNTIQEIL